MTMLSPEQLRDGGRYYFDADDGFKPVAFIERFCRHHEGEHVGKAFTLAPIQRRIVRDLFGWKVRATGLRRFTDCYFEAAIGAGKSPLLAGIGLFRLMDDGEPGAQVYSLASTYSQARIVFDAAKRFATADPDLAARLDVTQYEIRHPRSGSFWRIVSGKGPGAGARPTTILGDEIHNWANAGGYNALRDRMGKRRQPLFIGATNAGDSRASFCYQLRDKAVRALAGTGEATMYPLVFANDDPGTESGRHAMAADPEAWKRANPLLGITMKPETIRAALSEAVADPDPDAFPKFCRNYLGIWPTVSGDRWLDLGEWQACERLADAAPPMAGATLYVGLDMSLGDDLCAAAFVWVTADRYYITTHFWLPEETCDLYDRKESIPYREWAAGKHLTILPGRTVSDTARVWIADAIVGMAKAAGAKIGGVAFDPYKADATVARIEKSGVACVEVRQGYSVSPGCFELERRIKDRSAVVYHNPVMSFCVENCTVKADDKGNIWPVKPNARGKYKGKRGKKIDGVAALVTALTIARKHSFPRKDEKEWAGTVDSI